MSAIARAFPAVHRQCPGIMRTRSKFLHVIARSEATWQSVTPAVAQNEKQRLWQIRSCLRTHPGTTLLHPRTPAHLLHVIARSEATWQSVTPAAAQSKEQRLRRIRESAYGFARSSASLPSFSAGKRIAAPVCALVRNDMQKTEGVSAGTRTWRAMTCKRQRRACGCKNVGAAA